jgi:hypothetical protein
VIHMSDDLGCVIGGAVATLAAGGVMAAYVATAIVGLITGDYTALAVLMAATIAAWLVATALHAPTTHPRPGPAPGRDTHEVIHPEKRLCTSQSPSPAATTVLRGLRLDPKAPRRAEYSFGRGLRRQTQEAAKRADRRLGGGGYSAGFGRPGRCGREGQEVSDVKDPQYLPFDGADARAALVMK